MLAPAGAAAQDSVTVRGRVVDSLSGDNLPYVSVMLYPGFAERFSDVAGSFAFAGVAWGSYRLRVRQIGYALYDTLVRVTETGGGDLVLRVELRRLVVQLPAVTVVGQAVCDQPGPPDPGVNPELRVIFDQLRENAARYRLLAEQYPFRYWLSRILKTERRGGEERIESVDTLEFTSRGRRRYAPGRVVTVERGPRGGREQQMNIPEIGDLADSVFHDNHCFFFGGLDTLGGRTHFRVNFLAARRLRSPDVDGTAWLDTATFQLQRLTLRLTRPERAVWGVEQLEAIAEFSEMAPAIVVPARITATTTMTPAAIRRGVLGRSETQRLLRVEFLRPLPGAPAGPAP